MYYDKYIENNVFENRMFPSTTGSNFKDDLCELTIINSESF